MGSSDADYVPLRTSGTTDFVTSDDSTSIFSGNHGLSIDTWYHLAVTRSGTTVTVYKDGTALSGTGTGTSAVSTEDGELTLNWFNQSPHLGYGYIDQFMFIRGSALTTAQLGHLTGGGNANTHFGALGGLIAHEEYLNTTNVANTRTVALHTQIIQLIIHKVVEDSYISYICKYFLMCSHSGHAFPPDKIAVQ